MEIVMKLKFVFFLLFILIGVGTFTGCHKTQDSKERNIAIIEDKFNITFEDLNKQVNENYYHRRYRTSSEIFRNALYDMITDQLKCIDFFEQGFDKNQQIMQEIRRSINEELIVKYFEKEYIGRYTNEEFARKIYTGMGKEVSYQQIVILKPEGAAETQLENLKSLAIEMRAKAEQGANLSELTKKYSKNGLSINFSSNIPPITWEKSYSSQRDNIIFNLNVNDVRLLEKKEELHIVKITEIKKIKLDAFKKIKKKLINKLEENYYYESLKEYDQDKTSLIDTQKVVWNESALNQIIEWSNIPNFYTTIYKDTLQNSINNGRNFTILTYLEKQTNLKDYLTLLNEILIFDSNTKNVSVKELKKFILDALQSSIIVQKARELGLEAKILNPYTSNSILKSDIVYLYDKEVIESRIPEPTKTNLQKFYQENKETLYYLPEKINLYLMYYSTKEEAKQVLEKIKQGTAFEKISQHWFVKTFIKDQQGKIKTLSGEKPSVFGEIAFNLEQTEIEGPIEYTDPEKGIQYAVIKCSKRRPEKHLSYDEAQKTIVEDLKMHHLEKIKTEIEKSLRNQYKVTINENLLSQIIEKAGNQNESDKN